MASVSGTVSLSSQGEETGSLKGSSNSKRLLGDREPVRPPIDNVGPPIVGDGRNRRESKNVMAGTPRLIPKRFTSTESIKKSAVLAKDREGGGSSFLDV